MYMLRNVLQQTGLNIKKIKIEKGNDKKGHVKNLVQVKYSEIFAVKQGK